MGPLTAIICLAALIHQTDGQVGPVLLNGPVPGRVSLHWGRDLKQKKALWGGFLKPARVGRLTMS